MKIKRVKGGYQVFGSDGKALSKPGLRRSQCEERMKQVEEHRNFNAGKKPAERSAK
jgi:hypothetical protein